MSTRLPAARRREQLLDVALETFSARGYHATSMDDIAEAAGVTKPVLYQHFGSKRELYLELLGSVGSELTNAITTAAATTASPREQVEAGFVAYLDAVVDRPAAFRLLFGGGAPRDEEFADAVRRVESTIASAIADLITADIEDDQRAALAHAIVGMAEGTVRQLLVGGQLRDPRRLARQLADLAWSGLRGVRRI